MNFIQIAEWIFKFVNVWLITERPLPFGVPPTKLKLPHAENTSVPTSSDTHPSLSLKDNSVNEEIVWIVNSQKGS